MVDSANAATRTWRQSCCEEGSMGLGADRGTWGKGVAEKQRGWVGKMPETTGGRKRLHQRR